MLIKAMLVGGFLAASTTPIYLAANASDQDPARDAEVQPPAAGDETPSRAHRLDELRDLRDRAAEATRLQAGLAAALTRAEAAEARAGVLTTQVEECLDMLEHCGQRRERSCTPSRRMMVHYQWMLENDHEARAEKSITQLAEDLGNDNGRLNRLVWNLMTDDATAGKYDETALAIAKHMQRNPKQLSHQMLDTVALARFLNGEVDDAIALQKEAIKRGGRGDDYRRRLRTYEAAKECAARIAATEAQPSELEALPAAAARPELKVHEDE